MGASPASQRPTTPPATGNPRRAAWTPRLRRWVSGTFAVAVIVFLVAYVRNIDRSALAQVALKPSWLVVGVALGVGQRFVVPLVWIRVLRGLGVRMVDLRQLIYVYAKAFLGRYLPGKVAYVAARMYYAEHLGATPTLIAASSAIELAIQVLVATLAGAVGLATLSSAVGQSPSVLGAAWIVGVLAVVGLFPPVLNAGLKLLSNTVARASGRPGKSRALPAVKPACLLRAVSLSLCATVGLGVYVNTLFLGVDSGLLGHGLYVLGVCSLAGVLGLLAVFAPAGLGVREAFQLPMLSVLVPVETALALVVVLRLAEVCIDVGFFGAAWMLARLGSHAAVREASQRLGRCAGGER